MSKDPNLVVTLGGRPVPDQALGIRAFKDACLAASKTPPPQAGEWTLTAPDGRTWKAESPIKCCGLEQRERVPANVALARIVEEMERFDEEEAAKAASAPETSPDCPKCGFLLQSIAHFENCGHGHVVERHDGMRTRCGGPSMCKVCAAEQTAVNQP